MNRLSPHHSQRFACRFAFTSALDAARTPSPPWTGRGQSHRSPRRHRSVVSQSSLSPRDSGRSRETTRSVCLAAIVAEKFDGAPCHPSPPVVGTLLGGCRQSSRRWGFRGDGAAATASDDIVHPSLLAQRLPLGRGGVKASCAAPLFRRLRSTRRSRSLMRRPGATRATLHWDSARAAACARVEGLR
jgi:hypothetical protein